MPFSAFQQAILIGKYQAVGVSRTLAEMGAWLSENGVEVMVERQTAQHGDLPGYAELSLAEVGHRAAAGDWVAVVVGGDGTMLGAARQLAPYGVPLMGINSGRLGFITDIAEPDWRQALTSMLAGHFEREYRAMLTGEIMRGGERIFVGIAINDVVVNRSGAAGLVELRVDVDGRFMSVQRADGLIVATPTGSTAYAMSAGGPILHPSLPGLVLVPIAAHTLSNRPIVLPEHVRIDIEVMSPKDVGVNFDMQHFADLLGGDRISLRTAPHRAIFLHPPGWSYFATLRKKLHWHEILGAEG
ncbi:MAG: NAD kinase [Betaproteobacteria bacterium]|nr:NAD kinase [Betaproteobacteria bacterium]MDE2123595.1 NAD kinase [Betaproteobacteria bacterium]MDE2186147.1 NAD kinase [Betaproteobacteria bacterium]MDE2323144.1 NAD kinase [Betaproteobacteria bacterium]